MTDNHRGFAGELLPPEAIRKGVYDLGKVDRTPPEVGIFDAPTRCFVVNQEWWAHIAGMVHLLADVVSWKDADDESYFAIQAILKFMQGVDCAMNCEEVADCVESQILVNQELINAITLSMTNNGFGNPNHINPQITTIPDRNPVNAMQEEILELEDCNLDKLWGGIRNGIVLRLDDNARDLLEDLAGIPNVVERLAVFIDIVPVIGDLIEGLAFQITEIIPDLLALYNAYSSLETLDEIACEIFSLVCSLCRYPTFEEVFNRYLTNAAGGIPSLETMTLEQIAEYLLTVVTNPAEIAYNTIIVWEMFVLNAQAAFNGVSGTKAISDYARLGEDAPSNNWIQLCEVCDEPYRIKIWDFTETDKDSYRTSSYPTTSGHGIYIPGVGWIPQQLGAEGNGFISVGVRQDPTWRIRAIALKFANQAAGNGNMTFNILRTIPASNAGGTAIGLDWGTTGWTYYENGLNITAIKEYGISYSTQLNLNRAWTHFGVIYDAEYAPPDAQPIATNTFSGTVFP